MLGVLIGLIVFTRRLPEADARPRRAERRRADRARRGAHRRATSPRARAGELASRTERGRVMLGHRTLSTFVGPEVSWFALSPLLVLVGAALVPAPRRRPDAALAAGLLRARHGASPPVRPACWRWCCGTTSPTTARARWSAARWRSTRSPCSSRSRSASALLLVALVTDDYLRREGLDGPEVYALYLVAATGGIVMGAANDLIVLFVGLETLSLALLRARRQLPPQGRQLGERDQVLRARRVLVGVLPLRHRPRLRRHRLDEHLRRSSATLSGDDPRSSATTPSSSPASPCCSSGSGSRSPPCRSTCGRPTSTRARRHR